MKRKEAREYLAKLDRRVTAHETSNRIIVWHDDGSMFQYSSCYFEEKDDYLYVVPEHQDATLFDKEEINWMRHPLEVETELHFDEHHD